MKKTIFQLGLWSLLLAMVFACEEETEVGDPIASFQTETGEEGFRTINFINVSENATSSSWEFGDGSGPSTEENPVHTYEEAGSYEVTLTVTNDAGASDAQTRTVEVEDPNAALTLLAGDESKTWSLLRDGTSMLLANNDTFSEIYWAGSQNDGTRPCLYDDEFTFSRSGEYIYNDGGTFWAEYALFNNVADCDQGLDESCFEATAANMKNACGDDVSAWLSGTHTYSYDPESKKLTLTDEGAWIGIPKLGSTGQVLTPAAEASITANVELVDGGDSGVDSMFVAFD
jgi:PKD repeat protein